MHITYLQRILKISSILLLGLLSGQTSATRTIEVTETYDIWEYRYTGSLSVESSEVNQAEKIYAIVTSPSGESHRLTIGNYIGKDSGEIIEIAEDFIHITELMPLCDGSGDLGKIENYIMRVGVEMDSEQRKFRNLRIRAIYNMENRTFQNCLSL